MAVKRDAPKYGKHITNRSKRAVQMGRMNVNVDSRCAFKRKVGTGINGQLGARGKRSN